MKYHWVIYNLIFPRIELDPLLQDVKTEYIEALIEACKDCCASAEYAVYKVIYNAAVLAWKQGFLDCNIACELTQRNEPRPKTILYTKEELKIFLQAVNSDFYSHRLEYYLALFCGLRPGDDDDKIILNQRKPSKYKGLSRFGPEKNLQRINKFMKERPIFYKNLIQMKEKFRFYRRCFYCITKVVILQFNREKQDRISS